jgi:hypothetical protein
MKKLLSYLTITLALCITFTSCNKKEESKTDIIYYNSENPAPAVEAAPYLADAVEAVSGDAYLAVADTQWKAQYWGSCDDPVGSSLCYKAGNTAITGNGDYTVSITADTDGFRNAVTGNPDNTYTPEGIETLAVMIKDGETKFPNAVITVNEIRVDGKAINMTSKPYTSSDDGIDTKANIINRWTSKPSTDARTADGALYDASGNPLDVCKEYSPQVATDSSFAAWTTIEVDFTISGIE